MPKVLANLSAITNFQDFQKYHSWSGVKDTSALKHYLCHKTFFINLEELSAPGMQPIHLINVQETVTLFKDYPLLYVLNDNTTSWLYLPLWCEVWKCRSLHSTGTEQSIEMHKGAFQNIWVPSRQQWDFSQETRLSCIYTLFCDVAGPQCCNKWEKRGLKIFEP